MPKIRMPDGVIVAFPDDMPKEQIRSLIASKFPDAVAGPDSPAVAEMKQFAGQALQDKGAGIGRSIDSAVRGAADTTSFGLADEAAALGNATLDAMRGKSGQYDRRLDRKSTRLNSSQ